MNTIRRILGETTTTSDIAPVMGTMPAWRHKKKKKKNAVGSILGIKEDDEQDDVSLIPGDAEEDDYTASGDENQNEVNSDNTSNVEAEVEEPSTPPKEAVPTSKDTITIAAPAIVTTEVPAASTATAADPAVEKSMPVLRALLNQHMASSPSAPTQQQEPITTEAASVNRVLASMNALPEVAPQMNENFQPAPDPSAATQHGMPMPEHKPGSLATVLNVYHRFQKTKV